VDAAKILVVANPYEAARIAAWLEAGTLPAPVQVRTGDGSDETVAEFGADPADLIVLSATLDAGDSLALIGALRSEAPPHLKVVLIGDERGPVRTALDAHDYAADRFLRRPLAEKAVVFAVRSCLEGPARPPRLPTKAGLGPRPSSAGEVAGAMTGGAAGAAQVAGGLAGAVSPSGIAAQATAAFDELARASTDPPVFDVEEVENAFDEPPPDVAASVAAQTAGAAVNLAARLDEVTASMLDQFLRDTVSKTVDATVGADVVSAVEYTAEPPGDAERELMVRPVTSDFTPAPEPEAPPWREPTLILSGGSAPGEAVTPPPPAPEPPPLPPPLPVAGAGTIARELRRTMSAIEKRLFGDESSDGEVADAAEVDPDADIDLEKIAGATSPGFLAALRDEPDIGTAPAVTPTEVPMDDGFTADTRVFDAEGLDGLPRTATTMAAPLPAVTPGGMIVDLAREDTAALLARLHDEGFTGKLVFQRDDVQKMIFLDVGRPVFATSSLPHDRMGDLLYREGKITREQYMRSREIVVGTGRRMGEILVEMGFLKRRELLPAVRRHVEDVIYSLFGWDTGTVTITTGDAAQDERIRLATHPTALLFEGIRRKMDLPRLKARVGGDETVIVPLKRDDIAAALSEADLAMEERAAAELFDGRRTLAEVVVQSRIDATSVWQLAHALCALGLARAYAQGREHAEAARHAAQPSSLAGAAEIAIDRERVLAKHSHVLEADYFQVLGVRRDASAFEIKRAWEASRRDYAPEAFSAEVQQELGDALREIAAIVDEAFRVLRDGSVRTQYLENLKE
jgi:Domain of unknown function (DUF4388)